MLGALCEGLDSLSLPRSWGQGDQWHLLGALSLEKLPASCRILLPLPYKKDQPRACKTLEELGRVKMPAGPAFKQPVKATSTLLE